MVSNPALDAMSGNLAHIRYMKPHCRGKQSRYGARKRMTRSGRESGGCLDVIGHNAPTADHWISHGQGSRLVESDNIDASKALQCAAILEADPEVEEAPRCYYL